MRMYIYMYIECTRTQRYGHRMGNHAIRIGTLDVIMLTNVFNLILTPGQLSVYFFNVLYNK